MLVLGRRIVRFPLTKFINKVIDGWPDKEKSTTSVVSIHRNTKKYLLVRDV